MRLLLAGSHALGTGCAVGVGYDGLRPVRILQKSVLEAHAAAAEPVRINMSRWVAACVAGGGQPYAFYITGSVSVGAYGVMLRVPGR